jgi:hypothetical protein
MKPHLLTPLTLLMATVLTAACSSTGPKPDAPSGEIRKANTSAETLAELLDITRAGLPRRYRADRDEDVKDVLQTWAKTSGLKLQWNSAQRLSTSGGIDETDIRAAMMSLAAQFRNDQAALIAEFSDPKTLRVSDVKSNESGGCAIVPAGAIAIGRFCIASPAAVTLPDAVTQGVPRPSQEVAASAIASSGQTSGTTASSPTTGQKISAPQTGASAVAPAKPTPSAVPALSIEVGQRLSIALQSWLASQGVTLIWDVSAGAERQRDIEFISAWQSPSVDIEQTLHQLLPAFGLRAIVQDAPRTVIIRAASGTPSKTAGASK